MLIGLVYYTDDPDRIIRWVFPCYTQGETEEVLDNPVHITEGLDSNRPAAILKVPADDKRADFMSYISGGRA